MKYNSKYKIAFKFNPIMQCILGNFSGWYLVLEAFNNSRELKESDKINFTFSGPSQFNKLVKYIQKNNQLKGDN